MALYLELIWEFLKVGLFTLGGGLASIPLLEDIMTRHPWYTAQQFIDMLAVAQSLPGAVGANMSAYIGFTVTGAWGSILAVLSFALPSLLIASTVARMLDRFSKNPLVAATFYGLRPAVCALIASAAVSILKVTLVSLPRFELTGKLMSLFNFPSIAIFCIALYLIIKIKKDPIIYIAAGAVLGIVLKL